MKVSFWSVIAVLCVALIQVKGHYTRIRYPVSKGFNLFNQDEGQSENTNSPDVLAIALNTIQKLKNLVEKLIKGESNNSNDVRDEDQGLVTQDGPSPAFYISKMGKSLWTIPWDWLPDNRPSPSSDVEKVKNFGTYYRPSRSQPLSPAAAVIWYLKQAA